MKKIVRALVCALVALAAPVVVAQPMTADEKADVIRDIEKVLDERAFVPGVNLKDWQADRGKSGEAIAKARNQDEFVRAVNGSLREFGISHLRLRTPVQAQRREQSTTVGVGITSRDGDSVLHVMDVLPQSPAGQAGLAPGDVIVMVNGKPPEQPADLAGEENSVVELVVRREGEPDRTISVTRSRFSTVRPETLTWIDDQTALLKIYTFSNGYSRQNVEALVEAASGKAKYLLLDLRSNGGGATTNLRHLLSLLLPPETVVGTFVGKQAVTRWREQGNDPAADVVEIARAWNRKYSTARAGSAKPFPGRIAVLTNRASASASEIAAAALRECAGCPIIGQKTAGAVLSSTFAKIAHGFSLQYPAQDYVTVKGRRLEKQPLEPDIVVPDARRTATDEAVLRAIDRLKQMDLPPEIIPMHDTSMEKPIRRAA